MTMTRTVADPSFAVADAYERVEAGIVHASSRTALLRSVGTSVPLLCWSQNVIRDRLASLWKLEDPELDRWHRINAGSGIEARHGVLPVEQVIGMSTAERMRAYERLAPPLAHEAARTALAEAGMAAADVTDLIVVSCTGFSAPGVDVSLIESLGMRRTVRRSVVGFMGCFGAISGLRAAVGACCANPDAVALVVCVELCSLHFRDASDAQNMVASALFGDGAAAAVLTSREGDSRDRGCAGIGQVTTGASLLIPEGRDWMTWRVTDAGFAMTLAREVPVALRGHLSGFLRGAYPGRRFASHAVHPGGPGILDAADAALDMRGEAGLQQSREVLRRIGNVSSATVLFVLQDLLAAGHALPALLLAFGPGLTIESLSIET